MTVRFFMPDWAGRPDGVPDWREVCLYGEALLADWQALCELGAVLSAGAEEFAPERRDKTPRGVKKRGLAEGVPRERGAGEPENTLAGDGKPYLSGLLRSEAPADAMADEVLAEELAVELAAADNEQRAAADMPVGREGPLDGSGGRLSAELDGRSFCKEIADEAAEDRNGAGEGRKRAAELGESDGELRREAKGEFIGERGRQPSEDFIGGGEDSESVYFAAEGGRGILYGQERTALPDENLLLGEEALTKICEMVAERLSAEIDVYLQSGSVRTR